MAEERKIYDAKEPLYVLQKQARENDADAQLELGRRYISGEGGVVEKDHPRAFEWINTAATTQHPEAIALLGDLYSRGIGVAKDEKKAVEHFTRAAELGSQRGHYYLAEALAQGIGIPKDEKSALMHYEIASKIYKPIYDPSLSATLYFKIAEIYAKGKGVPKDDNKALTAYVAAADEDMKEAILIVANIYENGITNVIPKDEKRALQYYEKAALQGDVPSQIKVAAAAAHAGNHEKAFLFYKKAADLGDQKSQLTVAKMFENKNPPDYISAAEYYNKSGAEKELKELKANIRLQVIDVMRHPAEVKAYLENEAKSGDSKAAYTLGLYYEHALGGGRPDVQTAIDWYFKAIESGYGKEGFKDAAVAIGYKLLHGKNVGKDIVHAALFYRVAEHARLSHLKIPEFCESFVKEAKGIDKDVVRYHLLFPSLSKEDTAKQIEAFLKINPDRLTRLFELDMAGLPIQVTQVHRMIGDSLDVIDKAIHSMSDERIKHRLALIMLKTCFYLERTKHEPIYAKKIISAISALSNPYYLSAEDNAMIGEYILGFVGSADPSQTLKLSDNIAQFMRSGSLLDYNQLYKKGLIHLQSSYPKEVKESPAVSLDAKGLDVKEEDAARDVVVSDLLKSKVFVHEQEQKGLESITATDFSTQFSKKIAELEEKSDQLRMIGWRNFTKELQLYCQANPKQKDYLERLRLEFELEALGSDEQIEILDEFEACLEKNTPLMNALIAVESNLPKIKEFIRVRESLKNAGESKEAYGSLVKLADEGLTEAQVALADMLFVGKIVPKDIANAVEYYQKAADKGHPGAIGNLASAYEKAIADFKQDPKRAFELRKSAATQGSALSEAKLGWMYSRGFGCERDQKIAITYLSKPDSEKFFFVQSRLGWMYAKGVGVPKDPLRAEYYLQKALEQKVTTQSLLDAKITSGYLLEQKKEYKKAYDQYNETIERMPGRSHYHIGLLYLNPDAVAHLPQEEKKSAEDMALHHLKIAADTHHYRHAQFKLAKLYQKKMKPPAEQKTDEEKSIGPTSMRYYQKAADQGHCSAQFIVAKSYEQAGKDAKDEITARAYLRVAFHNYQRAAQGNNSSEAFMKGNAQARAWIQQHFIDAKNHIQQLQKNIVESKDNKTKDDLRFSLAQYCFDRHEEKPSENFHYQGYRALASLAQPLQNEKDNQEVGNKLLGLLTDIEHKDPAKQEAAKMAMQQVLRNGEIKDCYALYERGLRYLKLQAPPNDMKITDTVAKLRDRSQYLEKIGWGDFVDKVKAYAAKAASGSVDDPIIDTIAKLRLAVELATPQNQKKAIDDLVTFISIQKRFSRANVGRFFNPQLDQLGALKKSILHVQAALQKEVPVPKEQAAVGKRT